MPTTTKVLNPTVSKTTKRPTTAGNAKRIADLEAKLNKLAAAQDAKPAEAAPKPAETKPETKPEPKEAPKPAPKPAEAKKPEGGGGPHAHDEKPKVEAKVNAADKAKEDYAAKMAKKGATLPKGFIKDAKANTGH